MTDTITIDLGIKEKKITNKQIKDLESLFNYYSSCKSYSDHYKDYSESDAIFNRMIALKNVFEILGLKIQYEKEAVYDGIKYDCYKLVKK